MVRKLFSLLCGFLVAVAFKGVNTFSLLELKLNVNRDGKKEAGENPGQDSNVSRFWENEIKQDSMPVAK